MSVTEVSKNVDLPDPCDLITRSLECLAEADAVGPGQYRLELLVEANARASMGLYLTILDDEGFFDVVEETVGSE